MKLFKVYNLNERNGEKLQINSPDVIKNLRVLFINGTLKRSVEESNTHHVYMLVKEQLQELGIENFEYIHLAKKHLAIGTALNVEEQRDEMNSVYEAIKKSDIVIMGTPIWWNNHSSLIQRIIERLDEVDENYIEKGINVIYGKVFGNIITGAEDGVMHVDGQLKNWATYMGFTCPPECLTYWVGESGVGGDWKDAVKNETVKYAAKQMSKNLVTWAVMMKNNQQLLYVIGKKPYKS